MGVGADESVVWVLDGGVVPYNLGMADLGTLGVAYPNRLSVPTFQYCWP